MNLPRNARRRFVVNGLVQGVGFRLWARREALRLGIVGFVRNLSDGRVEALAEGPPTALNAFGLILSEGPPRASVSGVDVREEPARPGEYATFDLAF